VLRRSPALLALLLAPACLPRQSGEGREVAADPAIESEPVPRCAPTSDETLALLEASGPRPCGLMLELDDAGLRLRARARVDEAEDGPPAPLATGPAPEACGEQLELCELWGVDDPLTTIVVAELRGPESELPRQVYLGWVEGEQIVFVETWYGLPSVVDHTRVGPPWALAPFECDGELMLLPAPRLPEADSEAPDETLAAFAGRWRADEQGQAVAPEEPASAEASSCRALLDALP
jgi:hypothetical protein